MRWNKINNFPNYSVSEDGQVRNDKTGRILKFYKKPSGYMQVEMGHRTKPQYVHRLVALAFIPKEDGKTQVNHINGNKSDNRVENLEWVNGSENIYAYGYVQRNEHKKKKIIATNTNTNEQIIFNSRQETADYFKCHKSQIKYGLVYKKGNKKGWIFELDKDIV